MKVGDYVKTKDGRIAKIENMVDDFLWFDNVIYYTYSDGIDTLNIEDINEYIIKSSPNIIDLIGENDLITIEFYSLRYSERVTRLFEVTYKDDEYIVLDNAKCSFMLKNNDFNRKDKELEPIIKSIVTKEQFSQMEYKI